MDDSCFKYLGSRVAHVYNLVTTLLEEANYGMVYVCVSVRRSHDVWSGVYCVYATVW